MLEYAAKETSSRFGLNFVFGGNFDKVWRAALAWKFRNYVSLGWGGMS